MVINSANEAAIPVAVNAVAPAVQAWEMRRQVQASSGRKLLDALAHREPMFLPLSLHVMIAEAVVEALDRAGLLAVGTPPETPTTRVLAKRADRRTT